MTEKIAIHCSVVGKVQGVFFRRHTKEHAEKLGINGWVRNCADGTVEVYACGTQEHLNQMLDWLNVGPEQAVISQVNVEQVAVEDRLGFQIIE